VNLSRPSQREDTPTGRQTLNVQRNVASGHNQNKFDPCGLAIEVMDIIWTRARRQNQPSTNFISK
jgi:hypothetical protein